MRKLSLEPSASVKSAEHQDGKIICIFAQLENFTFYLCELDKIPEASAASFQNISCPFELYHIPGSLRQWKKQADDEVVPSSSLVKLKLS